ncbi:MAG: Hsp70 family protein [Nannocystaceae bacterium]|nr:Hsp70 family protein [Nannocystaceae bacterium]
MSQVDSRDTGAVVGIDLGTTNSVVATVSERGLQVIRDRNNNALLPSVVALVPNGDVQVGRRARERAVIDPCHTIHSAKRLIGRPWSAPDTQQIIAQLPYQVTAGQNDETIINTRAGAMSVVEISSRILGQLRAGAQQWIGRPVTGCVVTVPANFSDSQREATRRAAVGAGMEVLRILNEPTAAAVALGLGDGGSRRVGIFDLGGGTFDFTVLAIHDGLFEVLATGGEPYLGGDDFDHAIADRFAHAFLREHRVDLNADPESRAQVLRAAEQAKFVLSAQGMAEGVVPGIAHGPGGREIDLNYSISRADFEAIIAGQLDRALAMTERVLAQASLRPQDVDEIALVGGSTLIPVVQRRVKRLFGREPNAEINPLEVVAIGAAHHAHALWTAAQQPPTATPTTAAAYAPVETGLLMDVTSHSLGVATFGDNVQIVIGKNTTMPCEGTRVFSTAKDGQSYVKIRVCQGEATRFSESTVLGELTLDNLRPAARGEVQLAVDFIVDANGILQVSARDVATGQHTHATLCVLGIRNAPA